MLAIRMQRTGRKGHAMFRVIAQDSRFSPKSGRVAASLGHYDPHAKTVTIDKEKIETYLQNGAQPSPRVARLLKAEGVKLPDWVVVESKKEGKVRNADKRRSTRPVDESAPEAEPAESAEVAEAEPMTPVEEISTTEPETVAEPVTEILAEETETKSESKAEVAEEPVDEAK